MTQETIDGNKAIAEFLGGTRPTVLRYHENWNWLMPVANKIFLQQSVHDIIIKMGESKIMLKNGTILYSPRAPQNDTIKELWLVVVEFIKWHNQQKEK